MKKKTLCALLAITVCLTLFPASVPAAADDSPSGEYTDSPSAEMPGTPLTEFPDPVPVGLTGTETETGEDGPAYGWTVADGRTYYRYPDGSLASGLTEIDGRYYLFTPCDGEMVTGWRYSQPGPHYYYFGEDGAAMPGLQEIGGKLYFFDETGAMQTGWQTVDGKAYYFNDAGEYTESMPWTFSRDGVLTITGEGPIGEPYGWLDDAVRYNVRRIVIGEGITAIGSRAFLYFTAESVVIPASVETVGESAFEMCRRLQTVEYAGTEAQWAAIDIRPGNEALTAAYGPHSGTDLSGINWSVSSDGVLTLSGTGDVLISERDSYGRYTYPWSDLRNRVTAIVVGEGITGLGWQAFYGFQNAESVKLPESLVYIDGEAFQGCRMKTLNIPVGLEEIDDNAFLGCDCLETLEYAGTEAQWDAMYVGSGNEVLQYRRTGSLSGVPDGSSFSTRWTLDADGVLTVTGSGVFGRSYLLNYLCGLIRRVRLEEGVTGVDALAFQICRNLTELELPVTLEALNARAFDGTRGLTDIWYAGTAEQWQDVGFDRTASVFQNVTVHCADTDAPAALAALYLDLGRPMDAVRALQEQVGLTVMTDMELALTLVNGSADRLYELFGQPKLYSYGDSCFVLGALDGLLYYDGFTAETLLFPDGREYVQSVF